MAEDTKFTTEELQTIKTIQDSYFEVQNDFGKLNLAEIRLNQELDNLENSREDLEKKFTKIQGKEKSFLEETTKKYGDGVLNPETGVFTSNKS